MRRYSFKASFTLFRAELHPYTFVEELSLKIVYSDSAQLPFS